MNEPVTLDAVNGAPAPSLAELQALIAEEARALRRSLMPPVRVELIGTPRWRENAGSAADDRWSPDEEETLPDQRRLDRDEADVDEGVEPGGGGVSDDGARAQAGTRIVHLDGLESELSPFEQFPPFPVDALPQPICRFVVAGAKAIGCHRTYLALPLLSGLASAIGNTRVLELKPGWRVPAIIWSAIVGASGTAKTPAFRLSMQPFRARQERTLRRYVSDLHQYAADMQNYRRAVWRWKRDKQPDAEPPREPRRPRAERSVVTDTTVEALADLLRENPRGLLLACDELGGWTGVFDRWGSGQARAGIAHWLAMHDAESLIIDRRGGGPNSVCVDRAAVSVTGGVHPAALQRALASGLGPRLLVSWPLQRRKRWSEACLAPKVEAELARLVDRLYELQPAVDDQGVPQPVVVGMSAEAKAGWKAYYNDHAAEHAHLAGELRAAWSKLEEYAARLALVVHCVRLGADDAELEDPLTLDGASMQAGIRLAQWFKAEWQRVHMLLCTCDIDRSQQRLIDWIECKGGKVTVRTVQQGHRRFRTSDEAEEALEELIRAGKGYWDELPSGSGRPKKWFVLSTLLP